MAAPVSGSLLFFFYLPLFVMFAAEGDICVVTAEHKLLSSPDDFPSLMRALNCALFPHQQTVGTSSTTSASSRSLLAPSNKCPVKSVRRP